LLFNSIAFGLFLPIVFAGYWFLRRFSYKLQNVFLLIANYLFYSFWDYRFLGLVVLISFVAFYAGKSISRANDLKTKKNLLILSLIINFVCLGFFKYYNFFANSLSEFLNNVGFHVDVSSLNIILPLGISFYIFRAVTYSVDVYRNDLKPTNDILALFAYISFFPTMIAGPIDKAKNVLSQFTSRRDFSTSQSKDGLRQMLNGFLKKMVIADNLAPYTQDIFQNYAQYDGLTLLIGVFFFAIQIYCDFSGYSDIAIGIAKLFGFNVTLNFSYPYFSRDIAEFWRRWHISLSTWFRDYLYVPLCGMRPSKWKKAVNIIITFAICGLWHGPNWTYISWGILLGIYFIPITVVRSKRYLGNAGKGQMLPSLKETGAILRTFALLLPAWIFFNSRSVDDAIGYMGRAILHPFSKLDYSSYFPMLLACILLLAIEWIQREKDFMMQVENLPVALRWVLYYLSAFVILVFGAFGNNEFIYFQF